MTATEVLLGVSAAGVIAAVLGEVAWLRLGLGRRDVGPLPTVALMALGSLPAAMLLTRVDARTWPAIGSLAPAALRSFWVDHPMLGAVVAFVAWDAAGYCYHRLGHRTAVGWAAHRVHHSGTHYDLTLAWRQTWFPLHAALAFTPVALLGVELPTAIGCAAVSKLWQALVHTSLPIALPRWVTAVVMTPATHRRHHTVDGGGSNLGPVLTVWDRLAGTWDPSPVPAISQVGLQDDHGSARGAVRIETDGWIELARRSGLTGRSGIDPPRRVLRTTVDQPRRCDAAPGDPRDGPPGCQQDRWPDRAAGTAIRARIAHAASGSTPEPFSTGADPR